MGSYVCCRSLGRAGRFVRLPRSNRAAWPRWPRWAGWNDWNDWNDWYTGHHRQHVAGGDRHTDGISGAERDSCSAVPDKVTVATDVVASTTGYKEKTVDLTKYFTDTESPTTLAYTAVSEDKKTATVDADATTLAVKDGKLKIKAAKAGPTTITVTAFDGVNDGVPTTINVIVVANNSPPISERSHTCPKSDRQA